MARFALIGASLLLLGANYRTQHFIVSASTPELAQEVGLAAEQLRRDLAIEWLGHELPPWSDICPITVHVAPGKPAGGETSFVFPVGGGEPTKWRMIVEGTRQRVLDSVLPHEITHTIFATHFRQPLPRWADEGACTTVEHDVEKQKQERLLIQFLTTNRGIAFNQMFAMREYPRDILPLYSQGYALARYLIAQGGKRKFVDYVGEGLRTNNWTHATRRHYGFENLSDLQLTWLDWVREGSPPVAQHGPSAQRMAAHNGTTGPTRNDSLAGTELASASQEVPRASVPPVPLASASGDLPPPSRGPVALATYEPPVQERFVQEPFADAADAAAISDVAGNPVNDYVSNQVHDKGWYARQRDEAYASRQQRDPGNSETMPRRAPHVAPSAVRNQSSARPREIEGPKQVVLEWSRGHVLRDEPTHSPPSALAPPPSNKSRATVAAPADSRNDTRMSDLGYQPGSTRLR